MDIIEIKKFIAASAADKFKTLGLAKNFDRAGSPPSAVNHMVLDNEEKERQNIAFLAKNATENEIAEAFRYFGSEITINFLEAGMIGDFYRSAEMTIMLNAAHQAFFPEETIKQSHAFVQKNRAYVSARIIAHEAFCKNRLIPVLKDPDFNPENLPLINSSGDLGRTLDLNFRKDMFPGSDLNTTQQRQILFNIACKILNHSIEIYELASGSLPVDNETNIAAYIAIAVNFLPFVDRDLDKFLYLSNLKSQSTVLEKLKNSRDALHKICTSWEEQLQNLSEQPEYKAKYENDIKTYRDHCEKLDELIDKITNLENRSPIFKYPIEEATQLIGKTLSDKIKESLAANAQPSIDTSNPQP